MNFALSKLPHLHRKCANERFSMLFTVYSVGMFQHNIHELNWNELPSSEDCVGVIEFFSNFTKNSC